MIQELTHTEQDTINGGEIEAFRNLGYFVGSVVEAFVEGVAAALND